MCLVDMPRKGYERDNCQVSHRLPIGLEARLPRGHPPLDDEPNREGRHLGDHRDPKEGAARHERLERQGRAGLYTSF